jgi:alkylation response protein AidB-like acyl-CoA dehydrogenase
VASEDWLGAAVRLRPELDDRYREIEENRTLPADLVGALRQQGFFALALPAHLGGPGLPPAAIFPVIEELSGANAAVGWTVMVGQSCGYLDWLPVASAQALVAKSPRPVIAGSTAPLGVGRRTTSGPSGYVLTGRWPFGSGCLHADWLVGAFLAASPDRNDKGLRIAFFPRTAAVIHDTWNTYGLCGTGSHDIEVKGLFVDDASVMAPLSEDVSTPGLPHRLTFFPFSAAMMAGFPLGVARRAITEARKLLDGAYDYWCPSVNADHPLAQVTFLDVQAAFDAARCLTVTAIEDLCDELNDAPAASTAARLRVEYAVRHSFRVARQIIDDLLSLGAPGDLDHPLRRCHRDLATGAQHAAAGLETAYRLGATLLGLDERSRDA